MNESILKIKYSPWKSVLYVILYRPNFVYILTKFCIDQESGAVLVFANFGCDRTSFL